MSSMPVPADAPARAPASKRPRKKERGVYEHPPNSGVWWVCFYDQEHKRRRAKVGAKSVAKEVYRQKKNEVREGRYFPKAAPVWNPTFADHVATYLRETAATRCDAGGAERYARFWTEAPEMKGKRMRSVTRADLIAYRDRRLREGAPNAKRRRGGVGPTTVNKELSFARAVFHHFIAACEERNLPPMRNPARSTQKAPLLLIEPPARENYLTTDQEDALHAVMAPDAWAVVQFAIQTGLDRGAQCTLRWDAIDLQERLIFAERRKGRRQGPVPVKISIGDDLLSVLRALPSRLTSPWVFPNADATGPLDGAAFVRCIFRPALRRAGIPVCRWKDLRHTFATRLRQRAGADTQSIAELMGHTSTRMTERYAHAGKEQRQALVNKAFDRRPGTGAPTATSTATTMPPATVHTDAAPRKRAAL